MQTPAIPRRPPEYRKQVALVLQGGGALGSYQGGVCEALQAAGYEPDWVAGISIGAINAAIIAGNPPDTRIARLRQFWEGITEPANPWPVPPVGDDRALGALHALLFGQPGFFAPVMPQAWLLSPPPVSYYDTAALRGTLERLVDFDRINARKTRFSVGAVNVETGNFAYFDNARMTIRPEHVMASGALPPGFPAVQVEGAFYWDGGLVSNTPLQHVLTSVPRESTLTFQVDVFPARGPLPTSLEDVQEREKDVRFSSRTRAVTEHLRVVHDLRHNINTLWDKLPAELRETPEAQFLYNFGCVTTMDIVQLIYRPDQPQGATKDYQFSRHTMDQRWDSGRADAEETLRAAPWLAPMPPELGARTFDVIAERRAALGTAAQGITARGTTIGG